MNWHWPTEEGWFIIVVLTAAATIAGGIVGMGIMLGFFVLVNVVGNVMLP